MKYKIEWNWYSRHYPYMEPYVERGGFWSIKYRKHFWNRWKYVMDDRMIRQFRNTGEVNEYLNVSKSKPLNNE